MPQLYRFVRRTSSGTLFWDNVRKVWTDNAREASRFKRYPTGDTGEAGIRGTFEPIPKRNGYETPPTPAGFSLESNDRRSGYADFHRFRGPWYERVSFDYETGEWYACRHRDDDGAQADYADSNRVATADLAVAWLDALPGT